MRQLLRRSVLFLPLAFWLVGCSTPASSTTPTSSEVVYLNAGALTVALRASDGSQLWNSPKEGDTPPVVAGGEVYTIDNEISGALYALDARDGHTLWHFKLARTVRVSPVVVNGLVYLTDLTFFGYPHDTGVLDALDARDGHLLWHFDTQGWVAQAPVVVDGVVYLSAESSTYALDARDGHQLWSTAVSSNWGDPPTIVNGVVYVDGGAALRARDGQVLWQAAPDFSVVGSPVVSNGAVYRPTLGSILALDAQDGHQLWSFPVEPIFAPVVVKGVVCFGTEGSVYGIDTQTGRQLWRFQLGGRVEFHPLSFPEEDDGAVYITDVADRFLYALQASDGQILWRLQAPHSDGAVPVLVAKGVVYVTDGVSISALRASDGRQLWQVRV